MTRELVIAYDLGTGGCKAALVDTAAAVVAEAFVPYETTFPGPGRHEQRPTDWWEAVVASTRKLLTDHDDAQVVAIGLSGHSLAMVPVDENSEPLLASVPIWSDTRGTEAADAYAVRHDELSWYRRTGNGFPRGMYTVFKAADLRVSRPEIADRTRHVLGSKDWINARLTGVVATDPSYASGSGAFDLVHHTYLDDVLDALDVPTTWWPDVVDSQHVIGQLLPEPALELGLPAGVPVVAGGVDNSCMALGAGLDRPSRGYLSLGSSNWVSVAGAEPVLDDVQRPFVFAHVLPGLFVSALSTFGGGSSLTWLATQLGEPDALADLMASAEGVPIGARGLTCVPTLAGGTVAEGGPDVRGAFLGLDLGHTPADLTRAVVEGIGFSLADAAATMLPDGAEPTTAIGGGARSAVLLQVLADLLGRPVQRPAAEQHGAALGAAALALLGAGRWSDTSQLDIARQIELQVEPRTDLGAAYDLPRRRFRAARDAVRAHAAAAQHGVKSPSPAST